MRSRQRRCRVALAAPLVLLLAPALAGCGQSGSAAEPTVVAGAGGAAPTATAGTGSGPAAQAGPSGAGGTATPTSPASAAPSLPPGDPGLDAPTASDPGTSGVGSDDHGRARREIPDAALLGPVDAGQMLGGRWTTAAAETDPCTLPTARVGTRTVGLASRGSAVSETVSTHRGAAAADAAVAALRTRLPDCGWDLAEDPRLGTASLAATRGAARLGVVAAEGVTVVLVGRGDRATGYAWSGLLDMALGTSCAAADDCH